MSTTYHRKTIGLVFALAVLVLALLAACAPAGAPTAEDAAPTEVAAAPTDAPVVPTEAPAEVPTEAPAEVPTEVPTEAPTEAPAEAPTEVTVTHPSGETTVPFNPQRVVVLDYSTLDTLDQLGLGDRVVGVLQGPLMPEHLAQYNGPEYTNVGSFFELDMEAINSLEPDLIIVALRTTPFYEDMSAIAPTIDTTMDWANSLETLRNYVTNLGVIFGVEEAAAERLAAIDAHVAEVRAAADAAGLTGLIVLTSGGEVSGYGPGSRFGMIHDLLGIRPTADPMVAETHGDAISFEFIQEQNPDILFVLDRDAATGEEGQTAAQILDNELVEATTAGANDNIVYMNPVFWYLVDAGLSTFDAMVGEVGAGLSAATE